MLFEGWTPDQINDFLTASGTVVAAVAAVASALFALIAVRAQRAAQLAHVTVKHSTPIPVYGGTGRNLYGSVPGEVWFAIVVHNDGLIPVTVRNVALEFSDGGTAPFLAPPWPEADALPKTLAAGDEATFMLDELRKIAVVHAEHGGAKWVTVGIGGGVKFHGERIDRKWLDGWLPKA